MRSESTPWQPTPLELARSPASAGTATPLRKTFSTTAVLAAGHRQFGTVRHLEAKTGVIGRRPKGIEATSGARQRHKSPRHRRLMPRGLLADKSWTGFFICSCPAGS
jgi:hypothetical protein